MRGVQDEVGGSPFWEAIGRHFFDMDFASADGHSATDKGFIAELMPRHPIYIPLLPPEARAAVGAVHRHTRPALGLLEREGFTFAEEVDIFDGGPMYQAKTAAVRSFAQSVLHPVTAVHAEPGGTEDLICNGGLGSYRACLGEVRTTETGVSISRDVALALKVRLGDPIRWVASRPKA
jgi:arginine N-succinyltransferase